MTDFLEVVKEQGLAAGVAVAFVPLVIWINKRTQALELQDAKFEGDIRENKAYLEGLSEGQDEMRKDIKTILNHFATKGMDA